MNERSFIKMPKSTNKRDLIIQTALALFARHGYKGTTIGMITSESGVSQGLIYNFFKGKQELLIEIMSAAFQDIQKSMAGYNAQTEPTEAIEQHIRTTIKIIKQRSDFWRLVHAVRLQEGLPGVLMATYREIVTYVTAIFERVFKKLGHTNPRIEALLFLSQIDGMVILYLQDDRTPIDKLADQLIKRYKS
jgi:AcrR family transcriptional regulator